VLEQARLQKIGFLAGKLGVALHSRGLTAASKLRPSSRAFLPAHNTQTKGRGELDTNPTHLLFGRLTLKQKVNRLPGSLNQPANRDRVWCRRMRYLFQLLLRSDIVLKLWKRFQYRASVSCLMGIGVVQLKAKRCDRC